jgi:mannose-6-phosphate isomerase-like protein (cupin superfamily)
MDVVSIPQARRFSRERPGRVTLFDRPRLVCEVICLEPDQHERRRYYPASDELLLVIEGRALVDVGGQQREMDAQEAVLVPPGVEHSIANPGPGRLTALVLVAPKPTRAAEVRLPAEEHFPDRRREWPARPSTEREQPEPDGRGRTFDRGRAVGRPNDGWVGRQPKRQGAAFPPRPGRPYAARPVGAGADEATAPRPGRPYAARPVGAGAGEAAAPRPGRPYAARPVGAGAGGADAPRPGRPARGRPPGGGRNEGFPPRPARPYAGRPGGAGRSEGFPPRPARPYAGRPGGGGRSEGFAPRPARPYAGRPVGAGRSEGFAPRPARPSTGRPTGERGGKPGEGAGAGPSDRRRGAPARGGPGEAPAFVSNRRPGRVSRPGPGAPSGRPARGRSGPRTSERRSTP